MESVKMPVKNKKIFLLKKCSVLGPSIHHAAQIKQCECYKKYNNNL